MLLAQSLLIVCTLVEGHHNVVQSARISMIWDSAKCKPAQRHLPAQWTQVTPRLETPFCLPGVRQWQPGCFCSGFAVPGLPAHSFAPALCRIPPRPNLLPIPRLHPSSRHIPHMQINNQLLLICIAGALEFWHAPHPLRWRCTITGACNDSM
jgi:hypothetical protein